MPERLAVLDTPRHRCLACGTSCTGHWVEIGHEEIPGIEAAAAELGIERPFEADGLRNENGQCVFLDEDRLCRIHKKFGEDRKPVVCRQYPFVAIETGEDAMRGGIDPGCAHAWQSWKDGPDAIPAAMRPKRRPVDPAQAGAERALVALLAPGQTVSGALGRLCDGPEAFAARWVKRLKDAPLQALAEDAGTGFALRGVLLALAAAVPAWDPKQPPPIALDPAQDAWAVESARRMVFLRLASTIPSVHAVPLLALGGALACSWTDPARFGPLLGGWSRVMRWRLLWGALIPDADTLRWLARGP